jgi:hypothetical protein
MKLFQINSLLADLLGAIEAQDGELSAEAAAALDSLEMTRGDKLLDLGCAYLEIEAEAKAVKEVEQSLADRRKMLERRAEWLKGYVRAQLADGETVKDGRCRLSWRKSTAVEITGVVPDRFLKYPPPVPDRTAIKAALEAGPVDGAELVTRQHLQIGS